MDYTQSDANVTHSGTGHRMHQDTAPVTTMVSAADMNMVIWSLMAVIEAAGMTGVAFNPADPTTYQRLRDALQSLISTSGPVASQLGMVEGVPGTDYVHSLSRAVVGPATNAANKRYWPIVFSMEMPAGSVVTPGDVRHDHCTVRAQFIQRAKHGRGWAFSALMQVEQPATNNSEAGQNYSVELDYNNNTGYDVKNLNADGDLAPVIIASGGTNVAKSAIIFSKLPLAKGFFAVVWFREDCIDHDGFGIVFGNVAPTVAIKFMEDYAGGAAMETKNGQIALYMRTVSGPYAAVLANGDWLEMRGGNGGTKWANASATEIIAHLTNGGAFAAKVHREGFGGVGKPNGATTIDTSTGSIFVCADSAATTVTTLANPLDGQKATIVFTNSNTTIQANASIRLAGGANFVGTGYDTLQLLCVAGVWYELSRSLN